MLIKGEDEYWERVRENRELCDDEEKLSKADTDELNWMLEEMMDSMKKICGKLGCESCYHKENCKWKEKMA